MSIKYACTLDEIGAFFDRTLGAPVIARELAKQSKQAHWYRHDCAAFSLPPWREGEKPSTLPETIQAGVRRLSVQLGEEETALRDQFAQLSSILSVRESIRAQRWMFALTVLALMVASASLLVAIPAGSTLGQALRSLLQPTSASIQQGPAPPLP